MAHRPSLVLWVLPRLQRNSASIVYLRLCSFLQTLLRLPAPASLLWTVIQSRRSWLHSVCRGDVGTKGWRMKYASGSDTENAKQKSIKCQIIQAEGSSGCSEATAKPHLEAHCTLVPCAATVLQLLLLHGWMPELFTHFCSPWSQQGTGEKDILISCCDVGWNHTDSPRTWLVAKS